MLRVIILPRAHEEPLKRLPHVDIHRKLVYAYEHRQKQRYRLKEEVHRDEIERHVYRRDYERIYGAGYRHKRGIF